ncbi:molybdate ABC transporter permease subunit [Mumia zhuanghuii]|uniref:Molybdenum transport system permease n=2 Tax=Mumia TaxID=1546255 RepID=A0ABW1QF62_9ACTN|nr:MULTISPECIES: ABC transporter permease [Mumia]KAA1422712.1 molybdate ABC transporter permease subunit [Mumia zhuanghuii]
MNGTVRDRPALGRTPVALVVPSAIGLLLLLVPLAALLVRAPWSTFLDRVRDPAILDALRLSLLTSTVATLLCLVLGVPLAWLLARTTFRGMGLVRALVSVPLVLPPVVGGVALLMAFGRRGVVGQWLDEAFGVTIPFTTAAVVLAQTFVAMPFLVMSVEGALRTADPRYDEVAATLGARRLVTFWRVTLPLAGPGIAAGAALAWARALGEFGATITFAGSVPGVTRTMPLQIYNAMQTDTDTAIMLSVILLAISVAVLVALHSSWTGRAWARRDGLDAA